MQPTSIAYTPQQMQRYVQQFTQLCQVRGLRVTRQRLEVFRALISSVSHPGAETVWQAVRHVLPNISLDTVYRTLGALEEAGLVMRVGMSNQARFDGHLEPHHHFICTRCGEVYDMFLPPGETALQAPKGAEQFGKVMKVQLQLRGICTRCLQKESDVQ